MRSTTATPTKPDHETESFDRKFRQLVNAWLLHDDLRGANADLSVRMMARTELDAARLTVRQA